MIHSFLLIGQSNMAGRGDLSEVPPMECSKIRTLRNGRWQPMFRPVNPDRSFSGFNLAESFAEAYTKKYGVEAGLVCCADGGTSLAQWQEGGLLYENAVAQTRLAMRTSTVAAVLWHQGEADCAEQLHSTYRERFEAIMNALRRDLDLYDVPFLLGGLGDFLENCGFDSYLKNYGKVNEQITEIAKNNPMTGYVSAAGLSGKADNLHFDTAGLYAFGLRYFEAYEKLRDPNKVFEEKREDGARSAMEKL